MDTPCGDSAVFINCLHASTRDVPRLLAAVDVLLAALVRHQHKLTDSKGDCCAGCLRDWPCPDTAAVAAALLGSGAAS